MRIGLIRHFPVAHPFLRGWVTQSQVLQWFRQYDSAAVEPMEVALGEPWEVCYASQLDRAKRTAEALYKGDIICTDLLNEPFPDPVFKREVTLPFVCWGMLIRWAVLSNHASQSQGKSQLEHRINSFLEDLLSRPPANVLIVGHAFTMEILSELLLRKGFTGKRLRRPRNGCLYTFEKA